MTTVVVNGMHVARSLGYTCVCIILAQWLYICDFGTTPHISSSHPKSGKKNEERFYIGGIEVVKK